MNFLTTTSNSNAPSDFSIITYATRRKVNIQRPIVWEKSRIAIIKDFPTEQEENSTIPFSSPGSFLLDGVLRSLGVPRHSYLAAVYYPYRTSHKTFKAIPPDELAACTKELRDALEEFKPNIIVLLSSSLLPLAGISHALDDYRGSLFMCQQPGSAFYGYQCIASYNPDDILIEYDKLPLFHFDLKRAVDRSTVSTFTAPFRERLYNLPASRLLYMLETWPKNTKTSIDIEGGTNGWPCVSLCCSTNRGFVIVWSQYTAEECVQLLLAFEAICAHPLIPKVLQNGLYDRFVLAYYYGIMVVSQVDDTMIKSWEIYAELKRSLAVQASIYTLEPYWKSEKMYGTDVSNLALGCATDSMVTLEICNAQDACLPDQRHYKMMMELLNLFLYMELKGINYVVPHDMLLETMGYLLTVREEVNSLCGEDVTGPKGSLSSKKLAECLYNKLKYPPQFKKEEGRKTDKYTTDIGALLALAKAKPDDNLITNILQFRHLEGLAETLSILPDPDNRVRCRYSLEAETGRIKCYESPTGSGANLQTITKRLRFSYLPDPGYEMGQFDLEGADGWTVAARCASLGDPRMLEDYKVKMKPAKIIALLYWFGPVINELSREDLKWLHDNMFPIIHQLAGKWLYLGGKRIQHGTNYLMGIPTMQANVIQDSFKESGVPIYLPYDDAKTLQNHYLSRYWGIKAWHNWAEATLVAEGKLTTASGHTRIFMGGKSKARIHKTLMEFLAHEPQANTTHATNMAMLKLYKDIDNREFSHELKIQPLHQVHDAALVQWKVERRLWALRKMHEYFQNEMLIAGYNITIPYDGEFGTSWGTMKNKVSDYLEQALAV